MTWSIRPIALHRVLVPGPEVLFQRAFTETIELVIYAFVLRSGAHTVLVDTGLPADHAGLDADVRRRKGAHSGFSDEGERLATRLAAAGIAPGAILLTSLGPYATGGLAELRPVEVHVSARGLDNLRSPEEPALSHPPGALVRDGLAQAIAVSGRREIRPGLVFEEAGVHHPASAAVLVHTQQGRVAIADPVFHRRNLLEGIALGAAEFAAGWHALVRRLARECDFILPIHDPDPTPVPVHLLHPSLH